MSIPVLHGHDQTSGNSLMSFYLRVMSACQGIPLRHYSFTLGPSSQLSGVQRQIWQWRKVQCI